MDNILFTSDIKKTCPDNLSKLKKGTKLFFHKSCKFPRRKLQDFFPEYILSKSKNADFIVFDSNYYDYDIYYSDKNKSHYRWQFNDGVKVGRGFIDNNSWHSSKFMTDELSTIKEKVIFFDDLIQLTKKPFISEEQTLNILTLLKSNNTENIKLGCNLLTKFEPNDKVVGIFINSSIASLYNPTVEVKSMLNILYQNYEFRLRSRYSTEYLFQLYSKNLKSDVFKKIWQERIKLKLKLVSDDETTDTI
jgi:hypothetical protein